MIEIHRLALRPVALLLATLIGLGVVVTVAPVAAEHSGQPGMCNGRTDANVVVTAHAVGNPSKSMPKYVLNIESGAAKNVTGVLISGRGVDRLYVDEWCRVWKHRPDDEPKGECPVPDPGDTVVHAVGIGKHDGTRVLVRTDAKSTAKGMRYRISYREMGSHHEGADDGHDDGGCGGGWTRVPDKGWWPLTMLRVRPG